MTAAQSAAEPADRTPDDTVVGALTPPSEPGIFSFGMAELLYLCEASGTEAAERTARNLRFDPTLVDDKVRLGAVSSLIARGFLQSTPDEQVYPAYAGAAIAYAASKATRWVTLAFLGVENEDNAFLFRGAGLTVLAQRRAFGAYHVMVVDDSPSLVETIWSLVDAQLEIAPRSTIGLIIDRVEDPEGQLVYLRPHVAEEGGEPVEGRFDLARGTGTSEKPEIVPGDPLDEEAVDALLEELLADPEGEDQGDDAEDVEA